MEQNEIRKVIFEKRKQWSDEQIKIKSRKLFENLKKFLEDRGINLLEQEIFLYASYRHEADTWEFLGECLKKKIPVALPKIAEDRKHLDFYYIASEEDLERGFMGIMEPKTDCRPADYAEGAEHRMILVPGVAFDHHCNRIGYGKGYYDRYLASHDFAVKAALGFEFQIVPDIHPNATDIPMDAVATHERIYTKFPVLS